MDTPKRAAELKPRSRSKSPKVADDVLGLFDDDKEDTKKVSPEARRKVSPEARRKASPESKRSASRGRSRSRRSRRRAPKERRKGEKTKSDPEDLDRRITDFVQENGLEDRVGRIMKNMVAQDVEKVLDEGSVPRGCTRPNAVVVARIRRVEKAMQRPNAMKRYDNSAGGGGGGGPGGRGGGGGGGKRGRSPSPYSADRRSRSRSRSNSKPKKRRGGGGGGGGGKRRGGGGDRDRRRGGRRGGDDKKRRRRRGGGRRGRRPATPSYSDSEDYGYSSSGSR